jgi:hypothetical protein
VLAVRDGIPHPCVERRFQLDRFGRRHVWQDLDELIAGIALLANRDGVVGICLTHGMNIAQT